MNRAGYFNGFAFTKRELHHTLPKLRQLGWVEGNKVVKYRKIIENYPGILINIANKYRFNEMSLKEFKGFVLQICEHYLLRKTWREQNKKPKTKICHKSKIKYRVRDKRWAAPYKVVKYNDKRYRGFVTNSQIAYLLGISDRTVSRYRKSYHMNSYRHYFHFSSSVDNPIINGFEFKYNTLSKCVSIQTDVRNTIKYNYSSSGSQSIERGFSNL